MPTRNGLAIASAARSFGVTPNPSSNGEQGGLTVDGRRDLRCPFGSLLCRHLKVVVVAEGFEVRQVVVAAPAVALADARHDVVDLEPAAHFAALTDALVAVAPLRCAAR